MKTKFLAFVPAVVLGLYIGRLLGELWAFAAGSTSASLAVVFTLTAVIVCAFLMRNMPFRQSWPVLILLVYIFYPESSLITAMIVGLMAVVIGWQIARPGAERPPAAPPMPRGTLARFIEPAIFE